MRRIRFTIASLLGIVLFVAVAAAALREATELWDSAAFTLTLTLLVTAVLLAVHRTGARRAYWLGFALCGAAYLAASLVPPIAARLLTTRGLSYVDARIPGRDQLVFGTWTTVVGQAAKGAAVTDYTLIARPQGPAQVRLWGLQPIRLWAGPSGTPEHFMGIGHSVFALLAAFAGGALSRRLAARGDGPLTAGAPPIS